VPQNLTAQATGIREIKLAWEPSTDNIGIKEYVIYYGANVVPTGSISTTYKLSNVPLNTNFTFTVRAKDLGDNLSAASNSATENSFVNGLYYKHTTGAYTDIDLIDWNLAEFEGHVDNFTLSPRTQEDYFNFQFEGYLYISNGGSYQFQTTSDDGSRLSIDNVVNVDNDGQHGARTITGSSISLSSGAHVINVKYFEYDGGQSLQVKYKGADTGGNWVVIPDQALRSGNSSAASRLAATSAPEENPTATENVAMDIYPNPSTPYDNITVAVNGTKDQVRIKLMDMMGKSYYDHTFIGDALSGGTQIAPNERLRKGIYILVISHGDKTVKKKVIVKE
jgi:hypothetical protein